MKYYQISNRKSGQILGVYAGDDEDQAGRQDLRRHAVRDRLTGEIVYTTRWGTYAETHARAEKRARGDRYEVVEV